ncbi:MAG: hypothetical protein R3F60_07285 [bacterium]
MGARKLAGCALALALSGCGEEFPSRTTIEDYRVLGIAADHPELPADGAATVQVFDVEPDDRPVAYTWSLCFLSYGAVDGYRCADPALEVALDATGPALHLDFGPDGYDFRALYAAYGPFYAPDGHPLTLEEGVEVYVKLTSGPAGGKRVETVKRLRLRDADEAPNTNPAIEALDVEALEGEATGPRTVRLRARIDPAAEQTFVDPLTGAERTEELLLTWYTTRGSLDPGLTYGATRQTTLTAPAEPGPTRVFVAVRDGRGGLSVAEAQVP